MRKRFLLMSAGWAASRALLLWTVFGPAQIAGVQVTHDVSSIYQHWYEVLRGGTFPQSDVTWQYPPLAGPMMLAPGLLPFDYLHSFVVLAVACDAAITVALARAGSRSPLRGPAGAWYWIGGMPLVGPTVYARYDVFATAVAVAALLTAARSARASGALAGLGALLKVWPALVLVGTPPGPRTRRSWTSAALSAAVPGLAALAVPGAYSFLTGQKDRGVEVESMGGLVFQAARHLGWHGVARYHYGSMEFLGPYVHAVGRASLLLTLAACAWVALWRLRARTWGVATPFDAALTVVLLFVVTSRVISPQYLVWLVGLAAVCLTARQTAQRPVAVLVLLASALTALEFPVLFLRLADGQLPAVAVLALRNLLLAAAAVLSCVRLWRATVPGRAERAAARTGSADAPVPAGTGASGGGQPRP
jgi:hypothetical protein